MKLKRQESQFLVDYCEFKFSFAKVLLPKLICLSFTKLKEEQIATIKICPTNRVFR